MEGKKDNPIYTVYLISGTTKYTLTPAVESISFSDQKRQIAKSATIELANVKVGGKWLSSLFGVRSRVFIYADDGEESGEVWRGYVWEKTSKSRLDGNALTLRCYDNLIYWQESEEAEYFPAGNTTSQILSSLCKKWGVTLNYQYDSITHGKLALRGTLSDIIVSDILDIVKARTGRKYVVLSDKDAVVIKAVGTNTKAYVVKSGSNAIETAGTDTMDGMTTKVVIKSGNDEQITVEGTEAGDTDAYGTLQKIINRSESMTLDECRTEAKNIIKEKGAPQKEYEITTVDIPWIRKGDQVQVGAGDLSGNFIVVGIDRNISSKAKRMVLTLENP